LPFAEEKIVDFFMQILVYFPSAVYNDDMAAEYLLGRGALGVFSAAN
jgi:hypothetical protein